MRGIGIFDSTAGWHETRCSRTANEDFAFLRNQNESLWDKNGRHGDTGGLDPHGGLTSERYGELAALRRTDVNPVRATVTVRAGGRVLTKYNDGKSGYLSQSVIPLYFGLGDAKSVDRIEIQWPSGTKQVFQGPIEVNRLQTLEEK